MDPPPAPAFLSIRVPTLVRDRLKAAAATRGESVQDLVGVLVMRFLAESPGGPDLATVLARLRAEEERWRARGLAGLLVFGSVARGEAGPGSDVDLLAEIAPDARLSLVGLASLRAELADAIGAPADLVDRAALRPDVLLHAEREAVRAW